MSQKGQFSEPEVHIGRELTYLIGAMGSPKRDSPAKVF